MKDPGNPKIHELNRRVALCSQKDIVTGPDTMELRRTEVVWAWARIKTYFGVPAFIGQAGFNMMATKGSPVISHGITVRAGLGVLVTDTAYVYEEFRKSPPRWYK